LKYRRSEGSMVVCQESLPPEMATSSVLSMPT
jgi:hypothetical protein